MAITYDAPSNTLTVSDGTYNCADLYTADTTGGWGVVSNMGDAYLIKANLYLGVDANLIDTKKNIQIGIASLPVKFSSDPASLFQLGDLVNNYGIRGGGLLLYIDSSSNSYMRGVVNLYGVSISYISNTFRWVIFGIFDWNNVICSGSGQPWFQSWVYPRPLGKLTRYTSEARMLVYSYATALDDVIGYNRYYINQSGIFYGKNYKTQYTGDNIFLDGGNGDCTLYLTDSNYNITKIRLYMSSSAIVGNRTLYDLKLYNLSVENVDGTPIVGAAVSLTDSLGSLLSLTTDSNGDMPEQSLTNFLVTRGQNPLVAEHFEWSSPYTVEVVMGGYRVYSYVLDLNLDENKEGVRHLVALKPVPPPDPPLCTITGDIVEQSVAGDIETQDVTGTIDEQSITGNIIEQEVAGTIETQQVAGNIRECG